MDFSSFKFINKEPRTDTYLPLEFTKLEKGLNLEKTIQFFDNPTSNEGHLQRIPNPQIRLFTLLNDIAKPSYDRILEKIYNLNAIPPTLGVSKIAIRLQLINTRRSPPACTEYRKI